MRLLLPILYAICFIVSCTGKSFNEIEPNDNFKNANSIHHDSIVTGNFKSKKDVDFFKIDLRNYNGNKNLLRVTLSAIKGISTRISLFDYKLNLILISSDFFVNQSEYFANIRVQPTIYYIKLEIHHSENINYPSEDYKLSLELIKKDNTEYEPNNDFNTAVDIEVNTPITGYFNPFFVTNANNFLENSLKEYIKINNRSDIPIEKIVKCDIDLYRIRLPEQEKYNASIVLTLTENVNALLFLMDNNGKILDYRNNNGYGESEGIANLSLHGGKTYYIAVVGLERTINFTPYKDTYTLEFKTNTFTRNQEIEPNNSLENATPIINSTMKGYLSPVSDQDWYRLNITQTLMRSINPGYSSSNENGSSQLRNPDLIMMVKLKGIPNIDLMFEITDEYGKVLKSVDDKGVGQDEEIINFNAAFGKTYFIVVKGSRKNKKESFQHQYELNINFRDRNPNEEAEPNDTKKDMFDNTNNQIKLDSGISGFISPGGDVDFLYMNIQQPGRYEIKVTGIPNIIHRLEVFDPEDFSIGIVTSAKAGEGVIFRKLFTTTGLHYIVLKDSRSQTYRNDTTRYLITVKFLDDSTTQDSRDNQDN